MGHTNWLALNIGSLPFEMIMGLKKIHKNLRGLQVMSQYEQLQRIIIVCD